MNVDSVLLLVPEVIECGSCLAGGRREVELEVKNSGGEGRFSLRHTSDINQQVCLLCPLCS